MSEKKRARRKRGNFDELSILHRYVSVLLSRLTSTGELIYGDVTIDDQKFKLQKARDLKIMLGMVAYYHTLWAPGLFSGNVEFAELLGESCVPFDDKRRVHVVMRVSPYKVTVEGDEYVVENEQIMAVLKGKAVPHSSYPVWVGLFVISQSLLWDAIKDFYGPEDRQLVMLLRRASSIAKTTAKSLVPVFGTEGQLVSMEIVGFEDMIFNQLILHFLRERERGRVER